MTSGLVITRVPGTSFKIGEHITVQIIMVSGKKVRLRITSPNTEEYHVNRISEDGEIEFKGLRNKRIKT